jgi:hypothetical protein
MREARTHIGLALALWEKCSVCDEGAVAQPAAAVARAHSKTVLTMTVSREA